MKNQSVRQLFGWLGTAAILLLVIAGIALAQTTAFTYQGKLVDNGAPASGPYDLTFKLFDTATVGSGVQQGVTLNLTNVAVSAGVFTVQLDFGACASCFNGEARYLEISVKPTSGSTFTTLSPRQAVTANPYAIKSLSAASADGLSLSCVSCVTSSQIQSVNGSAVSGAIPVASVPAGSSSYIQNGTSEQAASNFNISGTGRADTLDVTTQYNIGGSRILSNAGFDNLFAGNNAGITNTGIQNAFFGAQAGQSNTSGGGNSFFGDFAGQNNTTGGTNSFFGDQAGFFNTTGNFNTFFGGQAGHQNQTGLYNSFFGLSAGYFNTTGQQNAFFGAFAGQNSTTGVQNTFIGWRADFNTLPATGSNNTLLGSSTHVNSDLNNATAIGTFASVTQSDSLVLGSINGINGATADTRIGIGTTAPAARLHVISTSANPADNTARFEAPGIGPNTSHIHYGTTGDWYIRSAAGTGNVILQDSGGNVGIGVTAPADKLVVGGSIRFATLGTAGSTTLCRNTTFQISSCSSSRRYKINIADWHSGMSLLNRLRPVAFDWKESKLHDLGLVAEEVAEVEPLLVTHNDKGEIEGVKYDRLGVVLINAIKEQQAQIDSLKEQQTRMEVLQKENLDLKARLAALERLVSQTHNHSFESANLENRSKKKEP